ncbi:hypothetical protein LSAT2_016561 [Lamellibrachia satsuma]|nr:hypothetical protein LSAT2_016561 [Lamellibrachia satsuma]
MDGRGTIATAPPATEISAPPPPSYDVATQPQLPGYAHPYPQAQQGGYAQPQSGMPYPQAHQGGYAQPQPGMPYPQAQQGGYVQPQPGMPYPQAQPGGYAQPQPGTHYPLSQPGGYAQPPASGYYSHGVHYPPQGTYPPITAQPMQQPRPTFQSNYSANSIDNFWYAVFVTFLCFPAWPVGIAAIYFGNKARRARLAGDIYQATSIGKRAAILGHLTVFLDYGETEAKPPGYAKPLPAMAFPRPNRAGVHSPCRPWPFPGPTGRVCTAPAGHGLSPAKPGGCAQPLPAMAFPPAQPGGCAQPLAGA